MKLNCNVPVPVTFNCWKHHAKFIKTQLRDSSESNSWELVLKKLLLVIGKSQMDLYLGKFSPVKIGEEIIAYLKKKKVFDKNSYSDWLSRDEKQYRLMTISDSSIWTLRPGQDKERYLHIHPGRQSPLTIRVKAHTLKTAIVSIAYAKMAGTPATDLNFINSIRKNFLNLPPLKSISNQSGLIY